MILRRNIVKEAGCVVAYSKHSSRLSFWALDWLKLGLFERGCSSCARRNSEPSF